MFTLTSSQGFAKTEMAVGLVALRTWRAPVPLTAEYVRRAADERVLSGAEMEASITAGYRTSFHMYVMTSDRLYVSAAGPPGKAFASLSEAPEEV